MVGPMGASGLALPGVERAMAEMEGQGAEKFAKLGRKDGKGTGMGVSPVTPGTAGGASATGGEGKAVPNEALHNFVCPRPIHFSVSYNAIRRAELGGRAGVHVAALVWLGASRVECNYLWYSLIESHTGGAYQKGAERREAGRQGEEDAER